MLLCAGKVESGRCLGFWGQCYFLKLREWWWPGGYNHVLTIVFE
jgi:hypothetical protein